MTDYEYTHEQVTYAASVGLGGGMEGLVRMTVDASPIEEYLDQAATAFFAALSEHYEIREVRQSVRATGYRPAPVFPTA